MGITRRFNAERWLRNTLVPKGRLRITSTDILDCIRFRDFSEGPGILLRRFSFDDDLFGFGYICEHINLRDAHAERAVFFGPREKSMLWECVVYPF